MKKTLSLLYVAVLVVMGAATFVEATQGTPYVQQHVYGAWWFTALWALLALVGAGYLWRTVAKGARHTSASDGRHPGAKGLAIPLPVLLLHVAFLVVLAGALLTHLTARSGTIHLRLHEPQDVAEITDRGQKYLHRLNFALELTDFQIVEDSEGRLLDYCSEFRILPRGSEGGGQQKGEGGSQPGFYSATKSPSTTQASPEAPALHVSMNHIARHGNLRLYQLSYDSDGRGSTLLINRDPYGIPLTYCGYALLFGTFIWLCIARSRKASPARNQSADAACRKATPGRRLAVPVATVLLTAAWCLYYFVLDGSWAQIPVLRHPLLVFHVVVIILAYALLLIQAATSAWALLHPARTPSPNPSRPTIPVPAAPSPTPRLLLWALCLLTIGIFLGAIWANISWGNYWSWDSKEVWALITLMLYALPLHRRSLPAFSRPRVYHLYMLLAFLAVLMTYFGVNYLLVGMHAYN